MTTSTPDTGLLSQPQPEPKPTPRTRHMRTHRQWKALLNEFNDSGLTRSAFCKKHRIATSSLYRWQQLFAEQSGGATDFIDVTHPLSSTPLPSPAQARDHDGQVELELGRADGPGGQCAKQT